MGLVFFEMQPRRLGCPALDPAPKKIKMDPAPFCCAADRVFSTCRDKRRGRTESLNDRGASPHQSYSFQVMTTEQKINDHTQKLESGEYPRYCQACPRCEAENLFRVHQCRRRSFRTITENCVRIFRSWICRLKCPNCKTTFTDYPPFRLEKQAVCQRTGIGPSKGVFGNRQVLSENGPTSRTVHCV